MAPSIFPSSQSRLFLRLSSSSPIFSPLLFLLSLYYSAIFFFSSSLHYLSFSLVLFLKLYLVEISKESIAWTEAHSNQENKLLLHEEFRLQNHDLLLDFLSFFFCLFIYYFFGKLDFLSSFTMPGCTLLKPWYLSSVFSGFPRQLILHINYQNPIEILCWNLYFAALLW